MYTCVYAYTTNKRQLGSNKLCMCTWTSSVITHALSLYASIALSYPVFAWLGSPSLQLDCVRQPGGAFIMISQDTPDRKDIPAPEHTPVKVEDGAPVGATKLINASYQSFTWCVVFYLVLIYGSLFLWLDGLSLMRCWGILQRGAMNILVAMMATYLHNALPMVIVMCNSILAFRVNHCNRIHCKCKRRDDLRAPLPVSPKMKNWSLICGSCQMGLRPMWNA